ncbi:MAG: DsbE family thiol:disulfide interchange protein [Pseudomonadota bacterium]
MKRNRIRFWAAWLPLAFMLFLLFHFWQGLGRDPNHLPSPLIGKPISALELPALDANAPDFVTSQMAGRIRLLNVWASWCIPCRAEHPILMELAGSDPELIWSLNWKDRPEDARAFLHELGNPFAQTGFDPSGHAGIALGVTGVPETLIIGADGIVHDRITGPLTPTIVAERIKPLLGRLVQ